MSRDSISSLAEVLIYTDGACLGNPGPGGYGVIIESNGLRTEKSGGFSLTTNNRMEIMAAICGLESVRKPSKIVLFSDSQYLVNAMSKGWVHKWKAQRWMRNKTEQALNSDLWERMLVLISKHEVEFRWVRGHSDHKLNERCDQIANEAAKNKPIQKDTVYEASFGKR